MVHARSEVVGGIPSRSRLPHNRQQRPLIFAAFACTVYISLTRKGAVFVARLPGPYQRQHVRIVTAQAGFSKSKPVPPSIEVDLHAGTVGATEETSDGDVDLPSDAESEVVVEEERRVAREVLLTMIEQLNRGFSATEAEKAEVNRLIGALAFLSPSTAPTSDLGGNWTLLYTNDPNSINNHRTPFYQLGWVGQEIDPKAGTLTNVIEYRTLPLVEGLVGTQGNSAMVQRIYTDYKVKSPTLVSLKVRGLDINPRRVLGIEVPEGTHFEAKGPLAFPYGQFDILYLDDEIRIVRTGNGWHNIHRREQTKESGYGLPGIGV